MTEWRGWQILEIREEREVWQAQEMWEGQRIVRETANCRKQKTVTAPGTVGRNGDGGTGQRIVRAHEIRTVGGTEP